MKKILLLLLIVCFLYLTAYIDKKIVKKEKAEEILFTGATLEIKKDSITPTGASIIIKCVNKNNVYVFWKSGYFNLEKMENDEWIKLENFLANRVGVEDDGMIVDYNHPYEIDINWEEKYGKLDKGKYRIKWDGYTDKINNTCLDEMVFGFLYGEFEIS